LAICTQDAIRISTVYHHESTRRKSRGVGLHHISNGSGKCMAVLRHIQLRRLVKQSVDLIAVLTHVLWVECSELCRPFEREDCCHAATIPHKPRRLQIVMLAAPVAFNK